MESPLKRTRPQSPVPPPLPASSKRVKAAPRFDSSGRTLYYLANEAALRLGLPAISLRRLLSPCLEDEGGRGGGAEAALVLTRTVEEGLAKEVHRLCGGKALIVTNETQESALRFVVRLPTKAIHCNLWIVLFSDRLRVVLPTCSLHPWDLKRHLHTVWFQDFALGYRPCRFSFDLCRLVYDLIPASVLAETLDVNLGRYDFSPVAVDLITSIPGCYPASSPFGLLQLLHSVPPSVPYAAVLVSTTHLPPPSFLLSLQANLNLPKYTTLLIGYPSYPTVKHSTFSLGGGLGSFSADTTCHDWSIYYDLTLKAGLSPSGKSVLPAYNLIVIGGEMIPEDQMVIYAGSHSFCSEDWGEQTATGEWRYTAYNAGVAFRPGALQAEEAKAILRSLPYTVGGRLGEAGEPWEPRRHLIYL